MKYLLVLGVIAGAIWLWRHNREQAIKAQAKPSPARSTKTMVACQHCGVHLPQADATPGTQGYYCGPEHQRQHEC